MSCGDATGLRRETNDLEQARQLWRAQNLHTYAFILQRSCFCANVHPLYVAVFADTVAGVIDLETGSQVDSQLGKTVEDLFTFVQRAIDQRAHVIRAEYDAGKGFPTEIDYDGAERIADDEIFFRASDVHPISPPGN